MMFVKILHVIFFLGYPVSIIALPSDNVGSRISERDTPSSDSRAIDLFNIAVVDENGNDAFDKLTIMHHHKGPGNQTPNQKRKEFRTGPQCTGPFAGWTDTSSYCVGPQAYMVICQRPNQLPLLSAAQYGACEDHEICVDEALGIPGLFIEPRAYCVSKNKYVKVAQSAVRRPTTDYAHIGDPEHQSTTVNHLISDAVLTACDGKTALIAKNLSIQALEWDHHNRLGRFVPLQNGTNQCLDCGRIGLEPVPANTSLVKAQVVLETAGMAGLLFLATISVG